MKAICKLANASTLISGVEFVAHPAGGMVSRSLTPEESVRFSAIPGYSLVREDDPIPETPRRGRPPNRNVNEKLD